MHSKIWFYPLTEPMSWNRSKEMWLKKKREREKDIHCQKTTWRSREAGSRERTVLDSSSSGTHNEGRGKRTRKTEGERRTRQRQARKKLSGKSSVEAQERLWMSKSKLICKGKRGFKQRRREKGKALSLADKDSSLSLLYILLIEAFRLVASYRKATL